MTAEKAAVRKLIEEWEETLNEMIKCAESETTQAMREDRFNRRIEKLEQQAAECRQKEYEYKRRADELSLEAYEHRRRLWMLERRAELELNDSYNYLYLTGILKGLLRVITEPESTTPEKQ